MTDLSIVIPARNEMFLSRTVQDILDHMRGDTEVIVVLDGEWANPPLPIHPKVSVIYNPISVGQRAAQNQGVSISTAKYVMKLDAHCCVAEGFDEILLRDMQPDWVCVPLMKNFHIFDWVCPDGHRRDQGPEGPCLICGKPTVMDIVWEARRSPNSTAYLFDPEPHFQYFGDMKKRPEGKGPISESFSIQGSCFMVSREKYWEWNLCDESWGSWGSQGIEVAFKTWMNGGRVVCNQNTWYAHLFRTQPGFGFPYELSGRQTEYAKARARELIYTNPDTLEMMLKRFWPVPYWENYTLPKIEAKPEPVEVPVIVSKSPSKGIIYYTDGHVDPCIASACRNQLLKVSRGIPIVSVSLEPLDFGINVVLPRERGIKTMFLQILEGLMALDTEVVYFCEHDVLYHPSHFDFDPKPESYFYNVNVWKSRFPDGHSLFCNDTRQTSGLCGYRELLVGHYQRRLKKMDQNVRDLVSLGQAVKNDGYSRYMGYEPGQHSEPRGVDNYPAVSWLSAFPNIDIRHDGNLTPNRWTKEEFRDQKYTDGWEEADEVQGWGKLFDLFLSFKENGHG